MKTNALLLMVLAAFVMALIGCGGGGGGGKSPEDAVKGMMDAVKAKKYEEAVSYMDIEGIVKEMRGPMEKMIEETEDEEMKKTLQKELDEMTVEKMKETMIKAAKEDPKGTDFTYKILETKDGEGGVKIVVVEVTEKDKEAKKEEVPVKKVGNVWKITMPAGEMGGPPE